MNLLRLLPLAVCLGALAGCGQTAVAQSPLPAKSPQLTGKAFFNAKSLPQIKTGDVTLLHFWTFGCSNCQANFAAYNRLFIGFSRKGVNFIGVHTPELEFEKKTENVGKAIAKNGIQWPVLIDTDGANWQRWNLKFWPTVFLLDRKGEVRFKWEGELAWDGKDGEGQLLRMIEKLLAEK